MTPDIHDYNARQSQVDRGVCDLLAEQIHRGLPEADAKVWHAHPVWFLDGNPVVGYSKLRIPSACCSGAGKASTSRICGPRASSRPPKRYTTTGDVDVALLQHWLGKARDIQWDYKNLVKRKGRLERLK